MWLTWQRRSSRQNRHALFQRWQQLVASLERETRGAGSLLQVAVYDREINCRSLSQISQSNQQQNTQESAEMSANILAHIKEAKARGRSSRAGQSFDASRCIAIAQDEHVKPDGFQRYSMRLCPRGKCGPTGNLSGWHRSRPSASPQRLQPLGFGMQHDKHRTWVCACKLEIPSSQATAVAGAQCHTSF